MHIEELRQLAPQLATLWDGLDAGRPGLWGADIQVHHAATA
jgi:hypothetical protein